MVFAPLWPRGAESMQLAPARMGTVMRGQLSSADGTSASSSRTKWTTMIARLVPSSKSSSTIKWATMARMNIANDLVNERAQAGPSRRRGLHHRRPRQGVQVFNLFLHKQLVLYLGATVELYCGAGGLLSAICAATNAALPVLCRRTPYARFP